MKLRVNQKSKGLRAEIIKVNKVDWEKVIKQKKKREMRKYRRSMIRRFVRSLYMEYVDRGDNGVCGPGFRSFGYYRLAWGKLAFILALVGIVLILILK